MSNLDVTKLLGSESDDGGPGSGGGPASQSIKVAGYRISKKLGQGAMGAVYKAEQLSLGRTVALKMLGSKYARDPVYLERFQREAQAAALLQHYNVVQVYDFGQEGDLYYIAHEYVDGGTVRELIEKEGVVAPEVATRITLQACRGLAAAEEHNIIHRDIKPDNLMLTKDGVVKVADFGLAKVMEQSKDLTAMGMIVGTPFYMSPEQARGVELDIRSDLYSLGVTFFHLVTGQIPFDGDSVISVLMKQISAERPDPASINPSLPNDLCRVISKMMAVDPERRYQTMAELILVLERLQKSLNDVDDRIEIPKEPTDRFERYKLLRADQILEMKPRLVPASVFRQLKEKLHNDAGVFIETDTHPSVDSLMEVKFYVPGREQAYRAFGIVRWAANEADRRGVGITFVKVEPIVQRSSTISVRRTAVEAQKKLNFSPEMVIARATETSLHCRLLRYYYANSNQTVNGRQIASALGVGKRLMEPVLETFLELGLIVRTPEDNLFLAWPEDEHLQEQLSVWISEYGLR